MNSLSESLHLKSIQNSKNVTTLGNKTTYLTTFL